MGNYTIAVAGSRGRTAAVAVETVEQHGSPAYIKRVVESWRVDPTRAMPREIATDVLRLVAYFRSLPPADGGTEGRDARVVVNGAVQGGAVLSEMREAKRNGLRTEDGKLLRYSNFPTGVTTVMANVGDGLQAAPPSRLASTLYTEYQAGRLEFAPGLEKLRAQMAAFVPVETKAGSIAFGNEDMSDYDDLTVALMHAVLFGSRAVYTYGVPRFRDGAGFVWPSRAMADVRGGSAIAAGGTAPEIAR
jgi:hypothetical protein